MAWLGLFLAGGSGVVMRAAIHALVFKSSAVGTCFVNILGCFLIGVLFVQGERLFGDWNSVVMLGFLGGFTTYSSYVLDIYKLSSQPLLALVYFTFTNLLGGLFCLAGLALATKLVSQ